MGILLVKVLSQPPTEEEPVTEVDRATSEEVRGFERFKNTSLNVAISALVPRFFPQFFPHGVSVNQDCVALGLKQQQGTIRNCSARKSGLLRFRLPRESPTSKRNPSWRHHTR